MSNFEIKNDHRKHIWQCQLLIEGKWVNQLKKPYPRKSAFKEKDYLYRIGFDLADIRIVNVQSERYSAA